MTAFDTIVLVIVGLGAVIGFSRGLVQEVLALAAWVVAVVAIRYFHSDLSDFLLGYMGAQTSSAILAFALLLLVPFGIMKMIARKAGESSRNSVLGPIDRVLGFGFGALKALIVVVVAFSLIVLGYDNFWGSTGRPEWITNGRAYPLINAGSEALVEEIVVRREEIKNGVAEGVSSIRDSGQSSDRESGQSDGTETGTDE